MAVAPRILFAVLAPAAGGDADVYLRVAENLFANGCVSLSEPATAACVPHWGGNHYPGFPAFIALSYLLLGHAAVAPLLAQAAVAAAAVVRLAHAAARLSGSAGTGIAAGLVAALSPLQVAWPRFVLTESLLLALMLWLVAELLLSLHQRRLRILPLSLALTGLAFVRHDGVLFSIAVPIVALAVHRPPVAVVRTLAVAALTAAPLLLWATRGVLLGLSFLPPAVQTIDGSPAPAGYIEWRRTWETTSYQAARAQYEVNTRTYRNIGIDPIAYRRGDEPRADQARVQALLAELADANGQPFPRAVDAAFAELARERRAAEPLRYWIALPVQRTLHIWFDPLSSNGWPAEIGAQGLRSVATQVEAGGVGALFPAAMANPAVAATKALVSGYRVLLIVGLAAAAVAACLGRLGPNTVVLVLAVAVFVVRTAFFVAMLAVQSRYLIGAVPFVETALVLIACDRWRRRSLAVPGPT
jgi:hypothetical protein